MRAIFKVIGNYAVQFVSTLLIVAILALGTIGLGKVMTVVTGLHAGWNAVVLLGVIGVMVLGFIASKMK